MSISCLANDLVYDANWYCAIPEGRKLDVVIRLLAHIAEVNPDAATLLSSAKCVCVPPGRQLDVVISLLCQIFNQGGVAKVCILGGVGAPIVDVPCEFSAYIEQGSDPNFPGFWLGDTVTGWHQIFPPC